MKLSIITINFNNLAGLQKTAESVISQTWKDFEWIIIDGGSTDGSKEYIITLYDDLNDSGWNPITYWCSEPDKGIYNAMNKGIANANGEYLNFMNSGDCFYEKDTLEKVKDELYDDDIIYGNQEVVINGQTFLCLYPDKLSMHYFLCNSIGHQSSFIKKILIEKDGYREDYEIISDGFAFFKWRIDRKNFRHLQATIARFDMSGVSSLHTPKMYAERDRMFCELFGANNFSFVMEGFELQQQVNTYKKNNYDSEEMLLANKLLNRDGKIKRIFMFVLKVLSKRL